MFGPGLLQDDVHRREEALLTKILRPSPRGIRVPRDGVGLADGGSKSVRRSLGKEYTRLSCLDDFHHASPLPSYDWFPHRMSLERRDSNVLLPWDDQTARV